MNDVYKLLQMSAGFVLGYVGTMWVINRLQVYIKNKAQNRL